MTEKSKLMRDVRVVIGENEEIESLLGDDMVLERDTLLETLIAPAIDKVHKLARGKMLRGVTEKLEVSASEVKSEGGCSMAELPEDVLFVTYVKARGWDRAVTSFIEDYGNEYDMCRSSIVGIMPNEHYPACAVLEGEDGKMVLEAYPAAEQDETSEDAGLMIRVVKKAEAASTEGTTEGGTEKAEYAIAEECYWAVVYTIANLYFLSVNDKQRAELMASEAAEHLSEEK